MSKPSEALSQDFVDQVAGDVGQAKVSSFMTEGQPGMIESEQMKDGGLKIVHMYRFFDHVETEFVGSANGEAMLETTPGQPHREGLRMMVPPQFPSQRRIALDHGGASELPSPDDQGPVQ